MNSAMMLQAMPQVNQLMGRATGKSLLSNKEGDFAKLLQGIAGKVTVEEGMELSEEGSMAELETMLKKLLGLLSSDEELESELSDWLQTFTDSMNISEEDLDGLLEGSSVSSIDQVGLVLTELYRSLTSHSQASIESAKGLEALLPQSSSGMNGLKNLMENVLFQLVQQRNQQLQSTEQSNQQTRVTSNVWQQLISGEQVNQTQTTTDFAKELMRLSSNTDSDKPVMNWAHAITGKLSKPAAHMPLDPVEQLGNLMRNVNSNSAQLVKQSLPLQGNSQQMMNQIEQMILSTRFAKPGGTTQLTVQLNPMELGEMILRFVKQDGEMTVKITVMSQMAKEMVDKNLHQLRHLFSPHQVVVERQIDVPNETNLANFKEKQEEQEEQSSKQQENARQLDEEDGDVTFQDYLFAEEV
ncbi:flagellar hook-length control protein FliK [Allobacillus sp. GCM10007491]|uniref:Flagellar hook-length control protein FliK n=1 Tax=Allobacillus saliphilus TaxID=2912308 RepID=A0A941CTL4_9BACI|nr:flagellar hook-length control protein FliK [Allobacillus saliphilus]MBR7552891.1 flagellar hook-length control protein FliK [Allobacillus saliphilus]